MDHHLPVDRKYGIARRFFQCLVSIGRLPECLLFESYQKQP